MTDRTGPRDRTPTRTCVGCRATDSWSALLRVVAATGESGGDAVLVPDPRHRLPGRGAWLHPDGGCLEQAVRRRAFTRALRLQAGPDLAPLIAYVQQAEQQERYLTTVHDRPTKGGSDADEHPMSSR